MVLRPLPQQRPRRSAGRPPQADPEATRARILQVATERFAVLGYSETPVSVLAADAGLTPGTLYYYFPSKTALYAAVAAEARRELEARFVAPLLARLGAEAGLAARLRLLVATLVERAEEDLTLHRLSFAADLEAGVVPVVGAFRDGVDHDLRRLYLAVAGFAEGQALTVEEGELLGVIETLTLGVWQFAMRPKGLERLPILAGAVDAWFDGSLLADDADDARPAT